MGSVSWDKPVTGQDFTPRELIAALNNYDAAPALDINTTGPVALVMPQVESSQTVTEAQLAAGVDPRLGEVIYCTLTAGRVVGAPLVPPVAGRRLRFVFTNTGNFTLTWNAIFSVTNWTINQGAGTITEASFHGNGSAWVLASNPPTGQSTGTLGGALLDYGGAVWNIKHATFGAKGGAQLVADGSMSSVTNPSRVTSASGLFTVADVGKNISVANALNVTSGPGSGGSGTITGFISATVVTVSFTCLATVSNAEVTWGYDDTPAFRAAITKVQAIGRGAVLIPGDTFVIQPQNAADLQALSITASNVTIMGVAPHSSRLWFRVYPFQDPKTNWQNNAGAVLRGNGFAIIGQSTTVPLANVTFQDFEFDGDAGYTGNSTFPANIGTGDGWDITMKAFARFDTGNVKYDNIKFLNVHSHSWRGENIYAGGNVSNLGRSYIYDCEINDTNGDGIADSGELYCKRNQIYKHAANGLDEQILGRHEVTDNYIHDIDSSGINIQTASGSATGPVYIENNHLWNCKVTGIHVQSPYNTWVRYNDLIDCGWVANSLGSIVVDQTPAWAGNGKGVHVTDNEIWANGQNLNWGIGLVAGATFMDDVEIDRNFVGVTALGIAAGKTIVQGYQQSGTVTTARIHVPYSKGTTFGFTDQAYAYEKNLSTTGMTTVAQVRPIVAGLFRVQIYFRVITGVTTVLLQISYYDAAGGQIFVTLVNSVAEPVGSYQVAPQIIAAQGATEAQYIIVRCQASVANQVLVSASIEPAF